jgi:hypothetical protein
MESGEIDDIHGPLIRPPGSGLVISRMLYRSVTRTRLQRGLSRAPMQQFSKIGLDVLRPAGVTAGLLLMVIGPLFAQAPANLVPELLRPAYLSYSDEEDADEQRETARLFEQIEGNFAFGEYRESINPAKLMVDITRLEYGPEAPELAEPMINLGQAYEMAGHRAIWSAGQETDSAPGGSGTPGPGQGQPPGSGRALHTGTVPDAQIGRTVHHEPDPAAGIHGPVHDGT